MKKIIGGILVALPFIAIVLLPLYTDTRWRDVTFGFALAFGIVGSAGIIVIGLSLIFKKD